MKASPNTRQAGKYLFYSVATTLVNWLTYSGLMALLKSTGTEKSNVCIFIANTLSWVVAVTFSFFVNKIRVFGSTDWKFKTVAWELMKFFSTRFAVGLLEIVLVPLLTAIGLNQPLFGVEGLVSKIVITPILIFCNYLFGKFFVF